MVEYGSITAALAILVSSLSGMLGSIGALPATDAKASALVAAAAKSQHVPGNEAHTAYTRAPYRKPVLRYLYAVAWVAAAHDRAKCTSELLLGPDPREAAAVAVKRNAKLLTRLRTAKLTVAQAATAIGRGTKDGCA